MTGAGGALGALLPRISSPPPGEASRAAARRLHAVESRNVTAVSDAGPIFWDEAAGANVRDADGNVYIDLTGAFGVALLGHRPPEVVEAVRRQSARLIHGLGDVHPGTVRLALLERLQGMAPWPDARAVLASTGAEAVEVALKTAWLHTGRPGILAFEGGYHGLTLGALAVTHREMFRAPFARRLYRGVAFAPFPDTLRGSPTTDEALAVVDAILHGGAPNGDPIGTVLVEPVQGRAGVRIPPAGFMERLAALAHHQGAVVVADEVFTGMGRCGAWYAAERVGLDPDIVCLGKALGAGLPLSACMAPRRVMEAWPESNGEALHTSTFLGHPLACAAAIAGLDLAERMDAPALAERVGRALAGALRERLAGQAQVGEIRGVGLFLGIELVDAEGLPLEGRAVRVAESALREGVIVLPAGEAGHVVELAPPAVLSPEQIRCSAEVLGRAVAAVAP